MSRNMVSALKNWKELFKTPTTKAESCAITREPLIRKALDDVAAFKLQDGTNIIENIHKMISKYLPIDYEDDNEYVMDIISVGLIKNGRDPYLCETLGKAMFIWVKAESGLMGYMPFRILLGTQVKVFYQIICEKFSKYGEIGISAEIEDFCWDSIKEVVLNEHNIMPLFIVPLFLCYREKYRKFEDIF